jgi:hypothetical protein
MTLKFNELFLILIFLIFNVSLYAQTASGDIQDYLNEFIENVPGDSGNNYSEPTGAELDAWESIIGYILEDDISNARTIANSLNYKINEYTDTTLSPNQLFYILEEKNTKEKYWGTYVFNPTPLRGNLILQAPHIKNDINTGSQAVYCLKNNLARAVFLNGTHRCNHSDSSSCSGTTSTCNAGSEPYRISDLAHNKSSAFQRTTEKLFNAVPNSIFIQLHGFGKGDQDPSLIISNGTRDAPSTDYAVMLRDALINEDNTLDAKIAHVNTDWERLIGFTNTQGRFSNYSTDACSESAEGTTGRFIHVEQELIKLRLNSIGWEKMSNALGSIFKEDSDGDGMSTDSDPDDNNACVPNPNNDNCNACNETIFFDDFDSDDTSDLGNWNDGGNNAFNSTLNALGDRSVRLKHGNENGNLVDVQSSMFTDPGDLSAFNDIKLELSYITPEDESYDLGDEFYLEISTDSGNNFTVVKTWEYGADFDQGLRYFDSVILEGPFTQNTVLRIRSFSNSDSDRVWIDNVFIKGCESAPLSTNNYDIETNVKLFPNPTSGKITIIGDIPFQSLEVYNITGQKVLSKKYKGSTNSESIDLSSQKSGIYFVNVKTENTSVTKKLIRL